MVTHLQPGSKLGNVHMPFTFKPLSSGNLFPFAILCASSMATWEMLGAFVA